MKATKLVLVITQPEQFYNGWEDTKVKARRISILIRESQGKAKRGDRH